MAPRFFGCFALQTESVGFGVDLEWAILQRAEERQYNSYHVKLGRKAIDLDEALDADLAEAVNPAQDARAFCFDKPFACNLLERLQTLTWRTSEQRR